ncbi:hypothetical protein [Paenibacillus sp. Leaf72]|uniref:hypothetical protein n=1 Tax=Paenibacillus sp. Leaf72 TaxID=1736234 RepID=UPI0006F3A6C2|nr:hypothetical protein [Paenibacillus sp. Leaf72]KQN96993.1 hypothetical protein ASF12_23275 [Paenibacillus sp. Leaf72]
MGKEPIQEKLEARLNRTKHVEEKVGLDSGTGFFWRSSLALQDARLNRTKHAEEKIGLDSGTGLIWISSLALNKMNN